MVFLTPFHYETSQHSGFGDLCLAPFFPEICTRVKLRTNVLVGFFSYFFFIFFSYSIYQQGFLFLLPKYVLNIPFLSMSTATPSQRTPLIGQDKHFVRGKLVVWLRTPHYQPVLLYQSRRSGCLTASNPSNISQRT